MTRDRRGLAAIVACLAVLVLRAGPALAERPATSSELGAVNRLFAATERSLHVTLRWVRVSTKGPFALAFLRGREQVSVIVLRGSGTSWASVAAISDEGLRCGLVPPAVIAHLHLERWNEGPHPCS